MRWIRSFDEFVNRRYVNALYLSDLNRLYLLVVVFVGFSVKERVEFSVQNVKKFLRLHVYLFIF